MINNSSFGTREKPERRRSVLLARGSGYVKSKLHGKTFLIPNFVTVMGMFCGFLAVISAVGGNFSAESLKYSANCILLAIILDGLDGRVARRLNATSAFGREFDSLSDVICFGVAPAILVYGWAFGTGYGDLGLLTGFVYVACGATRLARFNVQTTSEAKGSFTGLPIPGAAAGVVTLIILFPNMIVSYMSSMLVLIYMLCMSIFMVSTLPYFSAKHLRITQGSIRFNIFILSVLVVLAWKWTGITVSIAAQLYAFSGIFAYIWRKLKREKKQSKPTAGAGEPQLFKIA